MKCRQRTQRDFGLAAEEIGHDKELKQAYIRHGLEPLLERTRFGKSVLYEAVYYLGWQKCRKRWKHLVNVARQEQHLWDVVKRDWDIRNGYVQLEGHEQCFVPDNVLYARSVSTGKLSRDRVKFFEATIPQGSRRAFLEERTDGVEYKGLRMSWHEISQVKARVVLAR